MFKKRDDQKTAETNALLKNGWDPQLIAALTKSAKQRGLEVPSKDYATLLDGYALESNNFEIERRAYGSIRLHIGECAADVDVPVVVYFVGEDDPDYNDFHPHTAKNSGLLSSDNQTRLFGKAILNGRNIPKGAGKEDLLPVFEWHLYLRNREWLAMKEVLDLSDSRWLPNIGVRIGLPQGITNESIENDSMNSRLLIYRVWIDYVRVYSTERLNKNAAFMFDQPGT